MQGSVIDIARQTAMELGLPAPTELVTSKEQTSIQLLGLMNAAGNELLTMFEWQFLNKTYILKTVAGLGKYPIPADVSRMINQTQWDYGNRRPMYGPVSSQGWQVLTNALISVGPFARYRVVDNSMEILPVPGQNDHVFDFQYISNGWIKTFLDPNMYVSFITNDLDTPLFDFWLMVKFLKLKMWQAKGLDTTTYAADFVRVLGALTGMDHGAPVLGLANSFKTPWLTMYNVPDGNWNTGQP
jgi:hypothetical protein